MKHILTIVGARPQFIKAAAVSKCITEKGRVSEFLVHTGQHFDEDMSGIFFQELGLPQPDQCLGISGGGHGSMTGRMLQALEPVLVSEKPDGVLVYGDTNSTLAGALVAAKLNIPVLHVEAGMRSYNRSMPEEINRRMVDHLSQVLFCPTPQSVSNLSREGIREGVHQVGDVMLDTARMFGAVAQQRSRILETLGMKERAYVLASCHRASNVDHPDTLAAILTALQRITRKEPVLLPLHPRTRNKVDAFGLSSLIADVQVMEPLGFLDMLCLEQGARLILTDSGGVQKEAFFFQVPCITLRSETEWVETVESGWNTLAGNRENNIFAAYEQATTPPPVSFSAYGDGLAAHRIEHIIANL